MVYLRYMLYNEKTNTHMMEIFMYKKIGVVACSDPLRPGDQRKMELLYAALQEMNIEPVQSEYLYDRGDGFGGTGKQRAEALMSMYSNPEIDAICDVSGGDMANEVIPYLDFDTVATSGKLFFGCSDLTTILNAIYTKTGQPSVLYQLRNLLYGNGENQRCRFQRFAHACVRGTFSSDHRDETVKERCAAFTVDEKTFDLFDFPYDFVQGERMEGVLIGGNIRCFLKLAGTGYMPDFEGKILLLEAMGGGVPQMVTYLAQLKMLGAFDKINGILLGTFTRMEDNDTRPDMVALVRDIAGQDMPIAKTAYIGHGCDSRAALIGGYYLVQ